MSLPQEIVVVNVILCCGQKFTITLHEHECHGNLFELFYFLGGMIVQHTSLMTFKNKNWLCKFETEFSLNHTGLNICIHPH